MNRIEIPFSLPSLNDYIRECNKHRCQGSKHKKQVQEDIGWFINKLPEYKNPIKIHFIWVENKKPRDFDNVCFAKKYILDVMVKAVRVNDNETFWNELNLIGVTNRKLPAQLYIDDRAYKYTGQTMKQFILDNSIEIKEE